MVTIAHITESIIKRKPFLQEALLKGLINYGALADDIIDEVQQHFDKKVKHSAIMMALRRYQEKLESSPISNLKINKIADIKLQSNLIELNIKNNSKNLSTTKALFELLSKTKNDKIFITVGSKEITLVLSLKYMDKIKKKFNNPKRINNLAALTIDFDKDFVETPGFYYLILRELAWENINIIEIISTKTELNIIVRDEQVGKSYDVINKLLKTG